MISSTFSRRLLEPGEVDLPVVPQRHLGEDRQRLPELRDVDLRRIAADVALLLQLLHPHQAGTRRQMHQIGKLHIGNTPVLLQLVEDAYVDPVELHQQPLRVALAV